MKPVPQRGWKVTYFCAFSTVDGLAGLKVEDHFMLGPMVFENATDVFVAGDGVEENDEDGETDQAIDEVEENLAAEAGGVDGGDPVAELESELEGDQLIEREEEDDVKDDLGGHHPGRDFGLGVFAFVERRVGEETQGLHSRGT